jgi:hypothetical protein
MPAAMPAAMPALADRTLERRHPRAVDLTLLPFHPLGMARAIVAAVVIRTAIRVIVMMVSGSLDPALRPGVTLLAVWHWPGSGRQPAGDA